MNDVVERVARAIADQLGDDFDNAHRDKPHWVQTRGESGGRYRDINEPRQNDYLDAARAAIEAMREPTEAMIDAGRQAFLKDMRGRKLLKYLFEDDPSNVGAYGQLDAPIDLEVQRECATENVAKVLTAVFSAALADASPDIGKEG